MVSLKVLTSTLAEDSTRVSTICRQSYKTFFFFVADSQVQTIKLVCLFFESFSALSVATIRYNPLLFECYISV